MDCTNCKEPIKGEPLHWELAVVCQPCQMKLRREAMIRAAKRQKIFFTMNPDIIKVLDNFKG